MLSSPPIELPVRVGSLWALHLRRVLDPIAAILFSAGSVAVLLSNDGPIDWLLSAYGAFLGALFVWSTIKVYRPGPHPITISGNGLYASNHATTPWEEVDEIRLFWLSRLFAVHVVDGNEYRWLFSALPRFRSATQLHDPIKRAWEDHAPHVTVAYKRGYTSIWASQTP